MATSRRRRRCLLVGCHWRWRCGLVVGRLVAEGRESAFPAGRGRCRGTARPERGGGAHTTDWSKGHGRKRPADDRRGTASQSGSRHRDNHEDPSIKRKPGDSSSRATSQTLGEPFLRADPPEDHRTRLRARLRMDTKLSAVHPHVAGRPRGCPYGHRRRPRRINGARVDALLRRGLWQPARALTRAACRSSHGRAEGDPRWRASTTSPLTRSKAHGVDPPAPRCAAEWVSVRGRSTGSGCVAYSTEGDTSREGGSATGLRALSGVVAEGAPVDVGVAEGRRALVVGTWPERVGVRTG